MTGLAVEELWVSRFSVDLLKPCGPNVGLLEFQTSNKSTARELAFTVNVGVCVGALADSDSTARFSIERCHVRQRIGALRPQAGDHWWCLTHTTDVGVLKGEVIQSVQCYARPFISAYSDDNQIASEWIEGRAPGLTESERLRFLATLLRRLGRRDELKLVLSLLRDYVARSPNDYAAKQYLRSFGDLP